MVPSSRHAASGHRRIIVFFLALSSLIGAACGATAPTGKVLFDDPRGTVFTQAISHQSIQASHPINLDPTLIARVLSGLRVQERQRVLQEMLAGSSAATPVFSEEQVRFLAPQLAKALATATAEEAVAFRVTSLHPGTGPLESAMTETTAGSLYAYGLSLYVTLSQYRYAPARPNMDSSPRKGPPDTSGLTNRTMHFTPSAAQRPEGFNRPAGGASTDRVLAIDYQLLQQALLSGTVTEQASPQPERVTAPAREPLSEPRVSDPLSQPIEAVAQREAEIHTLKDLVIKKDLELETLRKELQSVRKQLDSRTGGQDSHKRKTTPPSQK